MTHFFDGLSFSFFLSLLSNLVFQRWMSAWNAPTGLKNFNNSTLALPFRVVKRRIYETIQWIEVDRRQRDQIFDDAQPIITSSHVQRRATVVVSCVDVGTILNQHTDAVQVARGPCLTRARPKLERVHIELTTMLA